MEGQMHPPQMPSHSGFMEVNNKSYYPHLMDALASITPLETKPKSKSKSVQRDSAKDRAQTIAKSKSKEKEKKQELSAAADEQLVFMQVLNELDTMC
ncbi:hypothetical protein C0995_011239 [Termitomyces sp. Mi166|nr:hypothetical protein C0995_011239 [Termitomyces sp. Mi166\